MTKTRRSLMVLLFMTLVLGIGLFLPNGVSKSVNAAPSLKVEVRSSKNQNWTQVLGTGYYEIKYGYAPFDWVTIAVTQPRAYPQAYTPPRTIEVHGNFLDFYGVSYTAALSTPFASYETSSTVTFFYRFDVNRGLKAQSSTNTRIAVKYDSDGDGRSDRYFYVHLPK